MNIEGTNVNPAPEDLPKKDPNEALIKQLEHNLEMLEQARANKIQITNQRDRDNIQLKIDSCKKILTSSVGSDPLIRMGHQIEVVHESRAETRGELQVWEYLMETDKNLKDQIAETETALKKLRKQTEK